MSAALSLPSTWAAGPAPAVWQIEKTKSEGRRESVPTVNPEKDNLAGERPPVSFAFYRRHTEKLLRRYLYASMQVGRAPAILRDPVGRGWASSHPVRTFEDAVIFVLDVESCIERLGALDQQLLGKIVLQEYTQMEAAAILGMSLRAVSYKFATAMDRLTELLLAAKLLEIPG